MKTTAIKIEGQIISAEIFDKIDSAEIKGQLPKDFGFESNIKVKDEIQRAWANAKDQWKIFNRNIEKLGDNEYGTTETRRYWIIPFLDNLGYQLNVGKAETVNEKSYAISHRAANVDNFPVHIVSYKASLDKRSDISGTRLSPHALAQEYINLTEHLYTIVTNGYQLRLLRDSGKLIRLTYLEFDLQKMMEEDLYAEFSIMYRIIHSSRMPQKMDEGDLSLIEQYHQDSLEAGSRIREKLSEAVEKSIVLLADGFLNNRNNLEIRKQIESKELDANQLYQYLLRFIYRVLFLMVIEERDIVYPENGKDVKYYKDIYYENYSISRLRRLSEKILFFNDKLNDLWILLRNTFKIFGSETLASKLKLYPLDGELFGFSALGVLSESDLDNHSLLSCIRNLSQFDDDKTNSTIKVNYASLNVEEFGSVYEGLLEKDPSITLIGNSYKFSFVKGSERSSSGSHYTPEELVQPLIKHSLDYVVEDKLKNAELAAKKEIASSQAPRNDQMDAVIESGANQSQETIRKAKEEALLSIKVCDVACGSGHILLSAARRIALTLTKVRTDEDQPSPEPFREAIRDVINNCIYGVDKNPLAVELCKVALWLEAHNPGMPLNFLDNKIRCGDSIVGLARIEELQNGIATEAFKTLPGDDKEIAAEFRKKNSGEIKNRDQYSLTDNEDVINKLNNISVKFKSFNALPDNTVEAVKKKAEEFNTLKGTDWFTLKELADVQTAQFFIQKCKENKNFITTDKEYFRIFAGEKAKHERQISQAMAVAAEKKIFHWFLEFPEVMQEGGFDCILGNPPFLGGKRISGAYGDNYLNIIKEFYSPSKGVVDLVAYFFRRSFSIITKNGFQALLSTNTISQGDTRASALEYITKNNGVINFAIKSLKWPGVANLEVSLLSITKGKRFIRKSLNNRYVEYISPLLDDVEFNRNPYVLRQNENSAFIGSVVLGNGFILSHTFAKALIDKEAKNQEIIFPYLTGEDLNSSPNQSPSRSIINFFDWDLLKSRNYTEVFEIVKQYVKPQRDKVKRKIYRQKWWQYAEKCSGLYKRIEQKQRVLVVAQVSRTLAFAFVSNDKVYSAKLVVFNFDRNIQFSILQSNFHNTWAWKYCTTMKTDLSYGPINIFQPFPFPQNLTKGTEEELEKIGEEYHEFRRQLMLDLQLGLTKTYNLFHNNEVRSETLENAKEAREFKNANLQITIEEAVKRIEKLRQLHKQMDEAVLKAYGWNEEVIGNGVKQSPINLAHDFYEVDYLPENDRVRYTISPEARKEVLKRLLELNHKIHEEEVAAGLWDKGKAKGKKQKGKNNDKETEDLFGG